MLSRRGMLSTLGLGALALPLLPSLRRGARAEGGFPTRLILVSRGQGTLLDQLVVPGGSPTDFALGPILEPLEPFRDRLVICGNVNDRSNSLDGSYNGHTRCLLHTWTAEGMRWTADESGQVSPTSAGGPSLDQVVAARQAGLTPYSSLEFGVGADGQPVQTFFWRGAGLPMTAENSPSAMFERLFEDLVGTDPQALADRRARREAVLGAVQQQLALVSPQVSADDRVKLEAHAAAVESVQQSLSLGALGDACEAPEVDLDDTSTPGVARAQIELLSMSLACDLTRVATLAFGDYQDWPWLGEAVDFSSGWHDAVHAGPVTADLEAQLIASYRWYAEQLALLLAALDAVPEGDGTLLDHCLIVSGNVFSTGYDHSHSAKTYLLAGGGAGLVGGRNLDLGGAHNGDLFATLLQGLGYEDEAFGDPDFGEGPLTGVLS